MQLIFQDQIKELDSPNANRIIEQINEMLGKKYYFSHFVADGIEVYENHEKYLNEHANHLEKLEIIGKTVKQFVNDILLSTEEYLERATPELTQLGEAFYDHPSEEEWSKLDQLLEGLQWLDEMLMAIGKSGEVPTNWSNYITAAQTMQNEIHNFAESMENEDNILIGDIIQYEILPIFEEFKNEIKWTMDNEGTRHDLN
ncbi:hypothetical protein [Sporosarcina koreensis]|uniref:hypothetical protein n=1 Tax=Sporosarcina koreensis TaxID=334735 RepID=UPI00075D1050|nr:hypothetical protein [Sporosarcina koreensis]